MPRHVSERFLRAAAAQETGACPVILLEITHDQMDGPLLVTDAGADLTVAGPPVRTYRALPFMIDLPSSTDDSLPQVRLRIDNVGREVVETLRTITSAPAVTVTVVLAEDPDVVEVGPLSFRLTSAVADAVEVEGTLAFESLLGEPFPSMEFLPSTHAGLF
ncbi:DUF1833 family protein [Niveispirillum sp.]|uniref:DUF1833 family protein n=1 Tax=Niveispirillum sp. TaxID=1917217 RepID=UPI001B59E45D|nr:DUF1833 family protein [Niveispirillum sp.]MBP7339639.1 DUF1833 family protein [Niveispirillum sp.]